MNHSHNCFLCSQYLSEGWLTFFSKIAIPAKKSPFSSRLLYLLFLTSSILIRALTFHKSDIQYLSACFADSVLSNDPASRNVSTISFSQAYGGFHHLITWLFAGSRIQLDYSLSAKSNSRQDWRVFSLKLYVVHTGIRSKSSLISFFDIFRQHSTNHFM